MKINIARDQPRKCPSRKPDELYLLGCLGAGTFNCTQLPISLKWCRACGHQVTFSRGFQTLTSTLQARNACTHPSCPRHLGKGLAGSQLYDIPLLWVDHDVYQNLDGWLMEARYQGVQMKIPDIPDGFKLGDTWVALAHQKVFHREAGVFEEGVFMVFQPNRLEYIISDHLLSDKAVKMAALGVDLVKIEPIGELVPLPFDLAI